MVVALICGEFTALAGIGRSVVYILIGIVMMAFAICIGLVFVGKYRRGGIMIRLVKSIPLLFLCVIVFCVGFVLCGNQQEIYEKYDGLQYADIQEGQGYSEGIKVSGEVQSIEYKLYQYNVVIDAGYGDVLAYFSDIGEIKHGVHIEVVGDIVPMSVATNPGNFDEREYLHSKGIILKLTATGLYIEEPDNYNWLEEAMYNLRMRFTKVVEDIATDSEQGIILAMALGVTREIDKEQKEMYSLNGISHILSISGLHISIVGMSIYKLLRKKCSYGASAIVSGLLMYAFLLLAGSPVSAKRAVIMFIVHIIADVIGRRYDLINSVSLAAVLLLIDNPFFILNSSFQLSFMAMVSVCFVAPMALNYFKKSLSRIIKTLAGALIFNMSLTFTMMPINSRLFYRQSPYSPLVNLIVVPIMGVALGASVLGIVIGSVWPLAGRFFVASAVYIIRFYNWICELFSNLPGYSVVTGNIETEWTIVYYIVLVILLLIMWYENKKEEEIIELYKCGMKTKPTHKYEKNYIKSQKAKRRFTRIKLVGVLGLVFIVYGQKENGFAMYFLDVGQGDCIYIRSQEGNDYLIDGGSTDVKNVGEYRIESFLEYMDVDELECVFISHLDSDHMSGIKEILERGFIDIEEIVLPDVPEEMNIEEKENYIGLVNVAKRAEADVVFVGEGDEIEECIDGEEGNEVKEELLKFYCVSPNTEDSYRDINDASMVLVMKYEELGVVFTGDISCEVEKTIKSKMGVLLDGTSYRVLKVGHHGSKGSSSEDFLGAVSPDVAVISCGEGNMYGHPHEEVVKRLEETECELYLTYIHGVVAIKQDGNSDFLIKIWKPPD